MLLCKVVNKDKKKKINEEGAKHTVSIVQSEGKANQPKYLSILIISIKLTHPFPNIPSQMRSISHLNNLVSNFNRRCCDFIGKLCV